jgi:hypothetical protein
MQDVGRRGAVHRTGLLLALLGMTLGASVAGDARAQEEAASSFAGDIPPIELHVSVVFASEQPGEIEPACLDLSRRLPMKFGSIRMVREERLRVPFGETASFGLPEGEEIRVLPISVHRNQLHLLFEMPGVMSTRMQLSSGRPVILGGIRRGDGLLIIQVQPDFGDYLIDPDAPPVRSGPVVRQVSTPQD